MKALLRRLVLLVLPLAGGVSAATAQDPSPARSLRGLPDNLISETDERPIALLRQSFLLPILATELKALELELTLLPEESVESVESEEAGESEEAVESEEAGGESGESERKQQIEDAQHEIRLLHKGMAKPQYPSTISERSLPLIDLHLYRFAQDHLRFDPIDAQLFEQWRAANLEFLEVPDLERRDRAILLRQQALDSWPHAPTLFGLIETLGRGPLSDSERREVVASLSVQYPELVFPAAELLARAGGRSDASRTGSQTDYTPDTDLPRIDGSEHPSRIIESLSDLYEEVSRK